MDCLTCKHHRKMPQTVRKVKVATLKIGCVRPVKEWMDHKDIMSNYPLYFEPNSIVQPCPNFEMDCDE